VKCAWRGKIKGKGFTVGRNFRRIWAITHKEFLHIIHDPRSLLIIFAMPVIQLAMFGYALNLEIQNVNLAVIDHARTPLSQDLIEQFMGSPFFSVFYYTDQYSQVEQLFLNRTARAVLVIEQDFDRQYQQQLSTPVQILLDGSDPNAATLIKNYCNTVIMDFNQKYGMQISLPIEVKPRILYNPDLKSAYFFVPGLIALLLVMISALLTSITITREKEMGTMEQILVSPVQPLEIISGKVLPYILIAFLEAIFILVLGMILFNVPFVGNVALLLLLSILYIFTALSLGLMISTMVNTQQVAMMFTMAITLLPTIMLSGFIFPLKSMPVILQYISYLVPAKYFLVIIRGIMLKGNSVVQLLPQISFLSIMSLVLLSIALRKFRLNLEK
jgi:ABC-2 type transport system permease protein